MNGSLEELYFNWLHAKVMLSEPPAISYNKLIRALFDTEFVWLLLGDDNRAEDGIELRSEFIRESHLDIDQSWFNIGCSILEMMISLCRRAEFQTEIHSSEWFWQLISNLGLSDEFDDNFDDERVGNRLYDFVWRTYGYSGRGGLFPMTDPPEDQRGVEIWYQFSEYLVDRQMI